MNRLVDSSYDGRKESFTYDKVGNRLTKTTNDITEKYVYNVKNQLKEIQGKGTKTIFTLDKQGNTLKEETTQGTNLFEYNTLNQQVKAITKDGNTLVNRYDSEGLRYEIEENEKLSRFIFNKNGDTLVELDQDNEVISRFTRGYEVVAADVDSKRYYYSVDEQGSTIFITDSNEQVKNEYWYDAFGNVLESREDIHNRITYTGQQFDKVTQQYYLRARFYNPVIGRFTQEDEYRGDGLNLYAYCGNNPVRYYDPSGYVKGKKCTNTSAVNTSPEDYTVTTTRKVGDSGQDFVYRVIRPEEDPTIGLVAKKPDRGMTTTGHVTSGSRNKGSQFISTTTKYDVANKWSEETGNRIVKIDLNQLPSENKVYDLSTDVGRSAHIKGSTANRLAKSSSEVLIEGKIPPSAIEVIKF